ncbi:hypothetical protein ACIPJG_15460 [Streptomyces halstedii]|uniref:hypothetical protein n=1 Tax=Streptomyces TaxID=1883 RepID=UPI00211D3498|nr:hypothetical protein [Streptomyces sp. st170]
MTDSERERDEQNHTTRHASGRQHGDTPRSPWLDTPLTAHSGHLDRRQSEVIYVLQTPVNITGGKNGHFAEHLPSLVQGNAVLSGLLIELLRSLLQMLAHLPVSTDEPYGVDYVDGHVAPHMLLYERS